MLERENTGIFCSSPSANNNTNMNREWRFEYHNTSPKLKQLFGFLSDIVKYYRLQYIVLYYNLCGDAFYLLQLASVSLFHYLQII